MSLVDTFFTLFEHSFHKTYTGWIFTSFESYFMAKYWKISLKYVQKWHSEGYQTYQTWYLNCSLIFELHGLRPIDFYEIFIYSLTPLPPYIITIITNATRLAAPLLSLWAGFSKVLSTKVRFLKPYLKVRKRDFKQLPILGLFFNENRLCTRLFWAILVKSI